MHPSLELTAQAHWDSLNHEAALKMRLETIAEDLRHVAAALAIAQPKDTERYADDLAAKAEAIRQVADEWQDVAGDGSEWLA